MKKLFITKFTCFIAGIVLGSQLQAQKIYGVVKGDDNKLIAGANVLLLNEKDSALVKGTITQSSGGFSIENIVSGKYLLCISFTGFKRYYHATEINKQDINGGTYQLTKETVNLTAVTLVSRKPMFEQKIDRMVINVKSSITSAGGTALEVLEKSPGVVVNRQNNSIALNGKDGVVIMINGKVSRMPIDAVVQMLGGMNASNIDRIELITTPPANFDAEGNAGFINIILLSNPNRGLNGTYSLTMGYGNGYSPAAAINFNYRNKKVNLFGDYSYTFVNPHANWLFGHRMTDQGVVIANNSLTQRDTKTVGNIARLGIDIQVTPKTIIGAIVGGYETKWTMTANNHNSILKNNIPDTNIVIINTELNQWKNFMSNINFSHVIKDGENITADIDYLYYKDNNPNDYTNNYSTGNGLPLAQTLTKSGKLTPFTIWVGKIDYTRKINKNINAEAGVKLTSSKFTNDVSVANLQQNNWIPDSSLTAKYNLKEDIAAIYSAFNIVASSKTTLKLGLRYEYTSSNLGSVKQQNIVDRKYGRFFPSVFISKKVDDNNSFNFSYSRRITRPTFKDMAPFVIFIDPYTFFSGNSGLQPAFSNIYKVDYILKNFVFSVSYTKEDGSIANFQPRNSGNKQLYASENLKGIKTLNVSLSLPFTISNWWSMQNNIQANWQQLNAVYDKGPFSIAQKNFNYNSSQNFSLPHSYSMELSGSYQSKQLFGAMIVKARTMVSFGVQKKFANNKSKLRFAIDNIFNSGKFIGVADIPSENIYSTFNLQFNYRTVKATYSYNFGNSKLKEKRNRSTASYEEQKRL